MANEKPLDLSTLQAGLKRYDDSLADVAKSGDYDDLVNKPDLSPWPLTDSGSGASVQTDGSGIFGVSGEGWSEQDGTTGKNLVGLAHSPNATQALINATINSQTDDLTTITANGAWAFIGLRYQLAAGTYSLKFSAESNTAYVPIVAIYRDNSNTPLKDNMAPNVAHMFTLASDENVQVRLIASDGDITNSTVTFRNLQLEAGSTSTDYEPYTGGVPSPSPDYPQEIRVARGRNLLPQDSESTYSTPGWTIGGSSTGVYVGLEAGQYAISADCITAESGKKLEFGFFDANNNNVGGASVSMAAVGRPYATVTLTAKAVRVRAYLNGGACKNIQLELGSTPTPYVPYGHVGLEVASRNLLPENVVQTSSQSAGYIIPYDGFKWLHGAGTFTLSFNSSTTGGVFAFTVRNSSKTQVATTTGSVVAGICSATLDFPDTAAYVDVYVNAGFNVTNVQIEAGTSPTEYTPYHHTTTPIPLPAKGFLGALPDGTKDTLSIDSAGGVVVGNATKEIILSGNESWAHNTTYGISSMAISDGQLATSDGKDALIDKYVVHHGGLSNMPNNSFLFSSTQLANESRLAIKDTAHGSGSASFVTWLASNHATLLYPLATPTTESLGYIALPELPEGATVSIPELEAIGVEWWVEGIPEIGEYGQAMQTRFQEELDEAEQALSDVATTGDYDDLINKPEHNPDDINNNIFRKGINQWSLDIKTGMSYPDSSTNTTTWTIQLTQAMIDVINVAADGRYSYIGGPLKYCPVRCTRDSYHQDVESIIKITRESTSIPDLQVDDEIVFTIDGQWTDYDDFWTGVDKLHIGEDANVKIMRNGSAVSGWTATGSYFAWDRITAKKVTADTIGDKDGTLAELRESVSRKGTVTIGMLFSSVASNGWYHGVVPLRPGVSSVVLINVYQAGLSPEHYPDKSNFTARIIWNTLDIYTQLNSVAGQFLAFDVTLS